MNNKILIAFNFVIAIAVGILYFLYFKNVKTQTPATNQQSSIVMSSDSTISYPSELKIAFVNTDSLLMYYDFYKKIEKDINNQKNRMETSMQKKIESFQTQYQQYMQKLNSGGFLTQATQQTEEQRLMKLQEEIAREQQELPNKFLAIQQKHQLTLNDTLLNYLKEYNSDKKYEYILGMDGNLLFVNQSHNITDTVLSALNERYRNAQKKK